MLQKKYILLIGKTEWSLTGFKIAIYISRKEWAESNCMYWPSIKERVKTNWDLAEKTKYSEQNLLKSTRFAEFAKRQDHKWCTCTTKSLIFVYIYTVLVDKCVNM